MRIVIVEPDSQGGLIHFAYQLADALTANGAKVRLITGQHYELDGLPHRFPVAPLLRLWPPVAEGGGAWHRPWPLRRAIRALILIREWLRLTAILTRDPPDVVLFSTIRFPFQALFLRALARRGVRMSQICHEFANREGGQGRLARHLAGLFPDPYRYFQTVFLFSDATLAAFRASFPAHAMRAMALPHGPEGLFEAAPSQKVEPGSVLMFGGLRPSKGVADLIAAFARMPRHPSARLRIIGSPSRDFDLTGTRALIARLGLTGRVTLDPRYLPMAELGAQVARAAVTVFPYRSATASGALALAQSLGRPVIATAVGGLTDAIEDGRTGRLVPPGDPDALAEAMAGMLDDPDRAEAMGAAARAALLNERGWDRIASRMLLRLRADATRPPPAAQGLLTSERAT